MNVKKVEKEKIPLKKGFAFICFIAFRNRLYLLRKRDIQNPLVNPQTWYRRDNLRNPQTHRTPNHIQYKPKLPFFFT